MIRSILRALRVLTGPSLLLSFALSCLVCAKPAVTQTPDSKAGASQSTASGDLRFKMPEGWVTEQPTSKMRAAQYKLPRAEGDGEDASLVLYYFGQGQGGTIADNVNRWIDQMQQPDGRPSKDKAKTETLTINGLKVTMVDVSGTYVAQMSPGSDARYNNPHYRLRAAIVETPKGNYFAKLVGPEKTVARWDQSFLDYVKSFEFR